MGKRCLDTAARRDDVWDQRDDAKRNDEFPKRKHRAPRVTSQHTHLAHGRRQPPRVRTMPAGCFPAPGLGQASERDRGQAHTGRVRGFEVIRSLRESLGRLHASCIMGSYWASRSSFTLAGCLHFAIRISRLEPGRQTVSKRLFIHTSRMWICESALLEPGRRFVFERLDASGMLVLLGQS